MNEIEMSKIYEDANNQSCAAAMEQSITFWKEKGLDFLREYREEYLKLMEDLDNKIKVARYKLENLERIKYSRIGTWTNVLVAMSILEEEAEENNN